MTTPSSQLIQKAYQTRAELQTSREIKPHLNRFIKRISNKAFLIAQAWSASFNNTTKGLFAINESILNVEFPNLEQALICNYIKRSLTSF